MGESSGSFWLSGLTVQVTKSIGHGLGISPQAVSATLAIVVVCCLALAILPFLTKLGYKQGEASQIARMVVLIVCYSVCCSMLLIINKVAVTYIPAASTILLCQLGSSAIFVRGLGQTGLVEVEPLVWNKAKKFLLLAFAFVAVLFTNMMALKHNPVDTLICFRASTPIVIAIVEYFFLSRELPSLQSWGSLIGVLVGVVVYVWGDIHFGWVAYMWLGSWYFFAVFDMVWMKHICDTVEMNAWTRTYYQNSLSVPPFLLLAFLNGDLHVLSQPLPRPGVIACVLSCIAGLGMSYFSFTLRAAISATSFSVIGNVCKILTILVNLLIWDKHSGVIGTLALFFCLFIGSFYKQAPLRTPAKDTELPSFATIPANDMTPIKSVEMPSFTKIPLDEKWSQDAKNS